MLLKVEFSCNQNLKKKKFLQHAWSDYTTFKLTKHKEKNCELQILSSPETKEKAHISLVIVCIIQIVWYVSPAKN
jgi:hypothetical protein